MISNKDFKTMVVNAILALEQQGEPSHNSETGGCFYLMHKNDGKKLCCIVGHMMPDNDVRVRADSNRYTSVDDLYSINFEWVKQFSEEQLNLLVSLQEEHDNWTDNHSIKQMKILAEEFFDENLFGEV
jgi:hypothetical protein